MRQPAFYQTRSLFSSTEDEQHTIVSQAVAATIEEGEGAGAEELHSELTISGITTMMDGHYRCTYHGVDTGSAKGMLRVTVLGGCFGLACVSMRLIIHLQNCSWKYTSSNCFVW